MKSISFVDKESYCRYLFDQNGPYWHIATPGNLTEILFTTPEEYSYGVTMAALCALESGIKVYAFEVMSNHLHEIVGSSSSQKCVLNLQLYSKKLKRWAASRGKKLDLPQSFVCEPIPIDNLQSLRNNIVYTHRNKYVADSSQTPFSYPYGSGILYFGPGVNSLKSEKYNDLPYIEKRKITNSRILTLPDYYTVRNGCISPESFCDWRTGMGFFRDAHQYFNMLTKNYEAYAEFSSLLGDSACITDEEMYSLAMFLGKKLFNVGNLSELSNAGKAELARKMHFDYHASNGQLRRILKMDPFVLDSMFPASI